MNNFELTICSKSGDDIVLDFECSEEAIAWMAGPEEAEDIEEVAIEAFTDDGQRVIVTIRRGAGVPTVRISDLRRDPAVRWQPMSGAIGPGAPFRGAPPAVGRCDGAWR